MKTKIIVWFIFWSLLGVIIGFSVGKSFIKEDHEAIGKMLAYRTDIAQRD